MTILSNGLAVPSTTTLVVILVLAVAGWTYSVLRMRPYVRSPWREVVITLSWIIWVLTGTLVVAALPLPSYAYYPGCLVVGMVVGFCTSKLAQSWRSPPSSHS